VHKGRNNSFDQPENKKKKFFVVSTHQKDWSCREFVVFEKRRHCSEYFVFIFKKA
jgi:hypothetical protein